MNELDAALIEIDPKVNCSLEVLDIGALTGVTARANLTPGQMVEMTGRTSSHQQLKIGGLAVVYRFRHNGQDYCFKDLFEVRWPRFLKLCGRRPIQGGDSGAWVCNPDANGFGWCGMIIGGDRLQGYAVYSETIKNWWTQKGLKLRAQ